MDLKEGLYKLREYLAWLLLGKHCYYCNIIIEKDEFLCENCREHLPMIPDDKCSFCGVGKDRCACKKRHMKFDGITSPFYYEDGIKECLKLLKFNGLTYMANRLATDMAKSVNTDFQDVKFDFICYVPFSLKQKITRRYNQSELLAENLSNELKIPLENALVKVFNTQIQHKTTSRQRKGNVFGIYDVKDGFDVKGKNILLVDDIMTTGETLNNCAVILKIRGAESVYCTTAAITPKKNNNKQKAPQT